MYSIVLCLNPAKDMLVKADEIALGEPNKVRSILSTAGGKGINVAKVLRNCDKRCTLIGYAGGFTGDWILSEIDKLDISRDFVRTKGETRTNIKLLSKKGEYTELNSKGELITLEEQDELYEKLFKNLRNIYKVKEEKEPVFFAMSGSIPQAVENSVYKNIMEAVRAEGFKDVKFFADCDNQLLKEAVKAKPFMIKPNIFEFSRLVDKEFSTIVEAAENSEKFFKETGINVLLTCGSQGAYLYSEQGNHHSECCTIPCCMPNGAGDTMLGAFMAEYAETGSLHMGLMFAMRYVREYLLVNQRDKYFIDHSKIREEYKSLEENIPWN